MATITIEISLSEINYTGIEAAIPNMPEIPAIVPPEMPLIPTPLLPDQYDPLAEKKEAITSLVASAILKYTKLFIIDPVEAIVSLFSSILGQITAMFETALNAPIPGINVPFIDFVTDLASRAGLAIKEAIQTVSLALESVKPLQIPDPVTFDQKNPTWEAMQKVQAVIKESMLTAIKTCMDIMKLVIDKVKLAFDLASITLGPPIDLFFEMLANIPSLITDGFTALMGMFGAAIDTSMEKLQETRAKIEEFLSSITTVFGVAIPGVPDVTGVLGEMNNNFWKEFVVVIQNWWGSFSSAIVAVFTDAINEFLDKVNAFLDYVDSLAGPAKTAFINAVNAISGGLMGAITGLPMQLEKMVEGKVTISIETPEVVG